MKLVQIVPVADDKPSLKALLKDTERRLRGGPTAFLRKEEGVWTHVKYPGQIKWDQVIGGIVMAEVRTRNPTQEWQLLQAFIGYVDRHIGKYVDTVTIHYR